MGDVVEMNSEGFFVSLDGLEPDEAIARCKVRADEIARWEDPIVEAGSGSERLDGWEPADSCLVYNNDGLDITLAQARQLFDAA